MFCPKCGTEVNPGDRFCRGCGSPIALEGEASQAQPDDQQTTAQPGADPFGSGNAGRQYGNPYGQQGGYNPQGFNYNQYQDRHGENEDASKGWIALGFFFPRVDQRDRQRRGGHHHPDHHGHRCGGDRHRSLCGGSVRDVGARGDAALTGGAACSVPSAETKWAQTTPFAAIAARRSPLPNKRKIGRTGSTTRSTASFRAATAVRPNTPRPTSLSSKKKNPRFAPTVGLVLYLVWNEEFPKRAKKIGKCAIAGFVVSLVVTLVLSLLMALLPLLL